jgi:hypothetical protein
MASFGWTPELIAEVQAAGVPYRTSWLQTLGIVIEVVCPVFALVFVCLRVYTRRLMHTIGWGRRALIVLKPQS